MYAKLARLILMSGITLCLIVGTVPTASAADDPYYAYFPWVPNGAMLGEMGPFYGALTVRSFDIEPVTIHFQAMSSAAVPVKSVNVPEFGWATLTAAEIGVPRLGSGVFVYATKAGLAPVRIAGVLKVAAPVAHALPEPLVTEPESVTSALHKTVSYSTTGETVGENSGSLGLPRAQRGSAVTGNGDTTRPGAVSSPASQGSGRSQLGPMRSQERVWHVNTRIDRHHGYSD